MSTYSDYPGGQDGYGPDAGQNGYGPDAGRGDGEAPAPSRGGRRSAKKRRRRGRNPVLVAIGWFFKILGTLLLIVMVTGCFVACYGAIYIQTVIMPEANRLDLSAYVLNEPSTVYYTDKNTGEPVAYATLVGNENRIILEKDDIPLVFKDVAVSIEDKRFYRHKGVDWTRTAAAVLYMFTGRDIQGGSTITQQVIKNTTQNDEVTVKRKVLEIFQALSVENKYSKDEILTMYLNKINLGGKICGIAAAAREYFDKDVDEINLPEAASIIAITNNPSLFSPYSTVETTDPETGEILTGVERNKKRQELILWLMCYEKDIALISEKEYNAAINYELHFRRGETEAEKASGDINSWYTDEVIGEVVRYFVSQGYTTEAAYDLIYSAGLHIYTPFDPDVQKCVDAVYNEPTNLPYVSKDGQQMQSCITIVDNSSGYVVAMAGAVGKKTGNLLWNYATDSTRQPGSSIKPLSVYSPAIDMGRITPYSILDDAPYQMLNGKPWPVNAIRTYEGLIPVYRAVYVSHNTVAVRILNDYVTPAASYQFLEERYGLTTLQGSNDMGASQLALGGMTYGVSPYEMTAAYATFPRGGKYTEPTVVQRVENRDHMIIWDHNPEESYPIKESTAYYMNQLLYNVVNESGARGATGTSARIDGMHVAGKTGTTSDNYDLWFAGYTPYYTAAVWTGYNRNATINVSPSPAVKLWREVMSLIHADLPDKSFFSVTNLRDYDICLDCGGRATEACQNDVRGSRVATFTFVDGTQPSNYCTCHVPVEICTVGSMVVGEDGQPVDSAFYQASDLCPFDTRKTVYLVDHDRSRNEACNMVSINDQKYMLSSYEQLPVCPYHSSGNWQDPNIGPTYDPNNPFNPNDPGINDVPWDMPPPSGYMPPDTSESPGTGEPPGTSESPGASEPPWGGETPGTSESPSPGTGESPGSSEPPGSGGQQEQDAPPADDFVPAG